MELLATETVGGWLVERGLIEPGTPVSATELEWGVSNVVLAVEAEGLAAVVKQALPRLRVEDEWLAKRERSLTEARALELAARLVPGSVPAVLAVDEERCAFAIAKAPASWRNWKELLLAGDVHADVGMQLGGLLAAIHAQTSRDQAVLESFDDVEAFEQLRVEPYHRTVDAALAAAWKARSAWSSRRCSTAACASCTATSRRRTSSSARVTRCG